MTAFRFIGRSSLDAVDRAIESALAIWAPAWCLEPAAGAARSRALTVAWPEAELSTGLQTPNGEYLFVASSTASWKQLLFGARATACPNDALAQQVIARSQRALLSQLLLAFGITETDLGRCTTRNHPQSRAHDGHARTVLTLADVEVELLLSPGLLTRFAPVAVTASEQPLSKRNQAVLASTCNVQISLDLGELPLATLQSLSVGDTLSSDTPLSQPFRLTIGDKLALPVFLGRVGDNKAVTFIKE